VRLGRLGMDEITFLRQFVAIPSPSGEEGAVAAFLDEQMAAWGFETHRDAAGNVLGSVGDPGAGRTIVLLGHMDTVPGLIAVQQVDGRLYGRGTVDAKGPLAAFVLAAVRVAPRLEHARITVIGVVEEETHGRGARHIAATLPAPYCALIGEPSGWEGLTLGYKGVLSLDVRVTQPAAHSAGQGTGPAEVAVEIWNRVSAYAQEINAGRTGRFDTLDPSLRAINTHSDGLEDVAEMHVALRLPPGSAIPALKEQIRGWCDGATLTFHPSDPPYQADKNTPLVRAMLRGIRENGGRPRFKLKTGTADMNIVGPAWDCPILAYGPGDSALDHTPEEHVEVDEFLRAVDVLERALIHLL
jgi:LysW-gamma-L-lysine carboxypeptidase